MPLFSWQELQDASQGSWETTSSKSKKRNGVNGICTDSRQPVKGQLFLALKGPHFNGHDFIVDAIEAGATAVCIDKDHKDHCPELMPVLSTHKIPCLVVENTLRAYQNCAKSLCCRFPNLVRIGITGSNGKTTTQYSLKSILKTAFDEEKILSTVNNTNNLIGVSQNLLRLTAKHQIAVIELGTNRPGEIRTLAELLTPTIAIITHIGRAHLAGFKTMDRIIQEKSSILAPMNPEQAHAIVPYMLKFHPSITDQISHDRIITFGTHPKADYSLQYLSSDLNGSHFQVYEKHSQDPPLTIHWPLMGQHQALNAAAAIAAAKQLGIDSESINKGLKTVRLPSMRMEVIEQNGIHWINDAYNANPESMRALIDWLSTCPSIKPRYLILGDMAELGDASEKLHDELLNYAMERLPETLLIAVGPQMVQAAHQFKLTAFDSVDSTLQALYPLLQKGDLVALKGSRFMKLEQLLLPNK